MKSILTLSLIDNGWILHFHPYDENDREDETAFTYQDDEDGKDECRAVSELLWAILEEIRPYSKHNKFNVVVRVEDQDGKEYENP